MKSGDGDDTVGQPVIAKPGSSAERNERTSRLVPQAKVLDQEQGDQSQPCKGGSETRAHQEPSQSPANATHGTLILGSRRLSAGYSLLRAKSNSRKRGKTGSCDRPCWRFY
jgi:hypothetical protein